jgi:hypothetical protein
MPSDRNPPAWLRNVVLGLLTALALASRLPAPWRLDVTNDEMYHIESWRTQYRTENVMPLFLKHLAATSSLSSVHKESLRQLYSSSPLFQRLLCVKSDYGSVSYSAFAEIIEAVTKSNLAALRMPSVFFSLATIALAYLLGKLLWDEAMGLWLAGFFAIGPLPQVYAGLGRSHGYTQFALLWLFYMFLREQRLQHRSPWRFLAVALLAQACHTTGWATIGMLVASELLRRYLEGAAVRVLVGQTWWYWLCSLGFFLLFLGCSFGTSVIGANVYYPGIKVWWSNLCIASPFGHLAAFGQSWQWASGIAWIALILIGLRALWVAPWGRGVRWPFLLILIASLTVPFFASSNPRHLLIYGVVPLALSAIGARSLFKTSRAALVALSVLLVVFTVISLDCRECPYRFVENNGVRYSEVAKLLGDQMKPGDIWINWPYFIGCPLYPYRRLPEPIMALTSEEFHAALRNRPPDHDCFVLMALADERAYAELRPYEWRREYPNGMILLKLAPRGAAASRSARLAYISPR